MLQIWQHGGGSDVASDRFTHFILLSLDSGSARWWGGSGPDNAVSDVHDCTVGVASCSPISPPLPSSTACDRSWLEYTGSALSQSIASAAVAARKILSDVRLPSPLSRPSPPQLKPHARLLLTRVSGAASAASLVRQR